MSAGADADLIVLHSLSMSLRDIIHFILHPRLTKKTVWVIWGFDLYDYNARKRSYKARLYSAAKKILVRRFPYVVARTPDYKLLKQWYGSPAKHLSVEPLYGDVGISAAPLHKKEGGPRTINIILGNSATESNRHLQALDALSKFKDEDIRIHIPLSYGDARYGETVKSKAVSVFGEKVEVLDKFMPPDEYNQLLARMDIGIFNNNRQQALGNLVYLFATGAKVYLNDDGPLYEIFAGMGISAHPIDHLAQTDFEELVAIDHDEQNRYSIIVREIFSESHGVKCWSEVFALARNLDEC